MCQGKAHHPVLFLSLGVALGLMVIGVHAENIDPNNENARYVWGENIGWLNLEPQGDGGQGVEVYNSLLTGYIWGENSGWIDLSPTFGGVFNDGIGNLSGYAWGENIGWINFSPAWGGVFIDACGDFNGFAWGENTGWISFRSEGDNPFKVTTAWTSPVDNIAPVSQPVTDLQEWFNSAIDFTLSATDCGSGVSDIHYTLDGDVEQVVAGSFATLAITTDGIHTLNFYSVDQEGNTEIVNTLTIRVDTTPPTLNLAVPEDGVTYLIDQDVPAVYSISDLGSGIATFSAPVPAGVPIDTSTGGIHYFTVAATDEAGNSNTATHAYRVVYPGNIDSDGKGSHFAWGENIGWINFRPRMGPGVTVTDTAVSGDAWGENVGWINLSPLQGGVINDRHGSLSGYAWGENVGWISFSCTDSDSCGTVDYGVTIAPDTGLFQGRAWGENTGWISFGSSGPNPYALETAWRSQNHPPVAVTNGPWYSVPGATLTFDGSASHDPDAGSPFNDAIVSHEWDLDGDNNWNEANGDDGVPVTPGDWSVVQKTFPTPVAAEPRLRVTDSFGLQDVSTGQFLTIALAYAEDYQNCWVTRLSRTWLRYGLVVTMKNIGNSAAGNVVATLTSVPTNRSIVSGVSNLGTIPPGGQASTACDPVAKTADIVVDLYRTVTPAGDWRWQGEFEMEGQHYVIPNLPPLGP